MRTVYIPAILHRYFIKKAANCRQSELYALVKDRSSHHMKSILLPRDRHKGCVWMPNIPEEVISKLITNLDRNNQEFIAFVRTSVSGVLGWSGTSGESPYYAYRNTIFITYTRLGNYFITIFPDEIISLTTKNSGPRTK